MPASSAQVIADKQKLRASLRESRRAIDPRRQDLAARAVRDRLLRSALFPRRGRVAAYLAVDGELDLGPLIEAAWNMGVRIYLPVITGRGRMLFRRYRRGDPLSMNRYGIREPSHSRARLQGGMRRLSQRKSQRKSQRISQRMPRRSLRSGEENLEATAMDLVLTPLVGFDRTGRRLGMGGGYYDRALALIGRGRRGPRIVGVAHACQEVEQIPAAPHDRALGWVLTERALLSCN